MLLGVPAVNVALGAANTLRRTVRGKWDDSLSAVRGKWDDSVFAVRGKWDNSLFDVRLLAMILPPSCCYGYR